MSGFEAHSSGAKKRDYWFTVLFSDPVALPISNFLAKRRWLTPDRVTILALFLGLLVGVFFAWAGVVAVRPAPFLIGGGLCFYLAFIVDCVDGKLARALGVTSERGKALDALADGARRASASFGLFVYLWSSVVPDRIGSIGTEAFSRLVTSLVRPSEVFIVVLYIVLAYYFLEIAGAEKGGPGGGVRGKWTEALARRRLLPNPGMPDVQAIVFVVGPITGLVVPALWVGIAMVTVAILLTVRRRLRVSR